MMSEGEKVLLIEPESSCFNRSDFMSDDFQVDKFVAECKKVAPLNVFKKELDDYLKSLKNALIELINQDYADFVNLSTNLVGMDKAINNLTIPLGQLREEILSVQNDLDLTINSVENKLKQRSELREKKVFTQNLLNITHCMEKIERVLETTAASEKDADKESSDQPGHLIERVASDFNQLQFYVTQCQGHPLVEKIRSRISDITSTLQKNLESSFQEGLKLGDTKTLTQCLRTYAIIDKISYAENLFRTFAVKPYMKIITEQALQSNSKGLKGLYKNILDFIPNYCSQLIDVTSGKVELLDSQSSKGDHTQGIKGYNFIVNSVWPEIATAIQNNLTSIFAPGDPDAFHKKYTLTMNFVQEFEKHCRSQENIKQLRSHPSYSAFISRWSLPVYFQIRFQEIAGKFEGSLLVPCTVKQEGTPLYLNITSQFWSCLERCWDDQVFLSALSHRFWKLTLQLISRLSKWLSEVKLQEMPTVANSTNKSATSVPVDGGQKTDGTPGTSDGDHMTISQMVYLTADIFSILKEIPQLWTVILSKLQGISQEEEENLKDILVNQRCLNLKDNLPHLSSIIIDHICAQSASHLDGAKNIPRLYRRTNREAPVKPSAYINALLEPITNFKVNHINIVSEDQLLVWTMAISESVSERFYNVTSDVLTSIKKTEDSLLRLKRIKKSEGTSISPATDSSKMTDDDKIRLQFALDAEEFGKQLTSLGIVVNDVSSYQQLISFVNSARNISSVTQQV